MQKIIRAPPRQEETLILDNNLVHIYNNYAIKQFTKNYSPHNDHVTDGASGGHFSVFMTNRPKISCSTPHFYSNLTKPHCPSNLF